MLNKLIHFITLKLIEYCESRGKVFFITGKNDAGGTDTYLIRYLLVNSKHFNFYIHRFLRSDHDVPHDHPWNFMTYVVEGEYKEHKFDWDGNNVLDESVDYSWKVNHRKKGSVAFRKATDVHKVEVSENVPVLEKERAPLTICITGPRIRNWGFWKDGRSLYVYGKSWLTGCRFVVWTEYLGIEDDSEKRG